MISVLVGFVVVQLDGSISVKEVERRRRRQKEGRCEGFMG